MKIRVELPPGRARFGQTETVGSPRQTDRVTPDVRNGDAILTLLAYRALEFPKDSGRHYRVPPIGWPEGFELQRLQYQFIDIRQQPVVTPDVLTAYENAVRGIVSLARRLLIPLGWRRWLWRLHIRPDPIKGATEGELGELLDFLLRCRTTAPVRLQLAEDRHPAST